MFPAQIPTTNTNDYSRCEQKIAQEKSPSLDQKTDAAIKESIHHALWKDDVVRAIEYDEIEVHVRNGIVYLNGHIVSTSSQKRIETAIRAIAGVRGIQDNLVMDDKLTLQVAASLGALEHTYDCKFFTGASHGVISLNGMVSDENVKALAEKYASSNPNVRGVINNVGVSGAGQDLQQQPFLQPTIGEIIYFIDGVSGVVKQVIINPNNRRVMAMTLLVNFTSQHLLNKPRTDGKSDPTDHLVVVPMNEVSFLTKESGFLSINSNEGNRYMEFNRAHFVIPQRGWRAPHPYCSDDVLFTLEHREVEYQILASPPRSPFVVAWEQQPLREQLFTNDSLGG